MNTKHTLTALKASAATMVVSLALISAPTFAQDAAQDAATDEADTIIVTGSRINRQDLEAASPVAVVGANEIQLASKPGVEEFLRNMPQAVPGVGRNNNNGNPGVATVNLRNLGEERTLVLVDGRRFVPYDSQGIVDLNMIPSSLVERVEVVTGGASAVYGSDAVAGVVNFIMKKNFTGIEADAQTGISGKGDGHHHDFSLTGGLNLGDRGNIVVNGTYSKQESVTQGARKFSNAALAAVDLSASGGSSTNEYGSVDLPGGLGRWTFTPQGFQRYSAARDSFNFNPFNLLQVPHEKWTATALMNYELTDGVEFFGRASYGQSHVRTEIAPSGTFGFSFNVNYRTNPFFDPAVNPAAAGARAVFASVDTDGDGILRVGVRRRTTEVGPRISDYKNRAWQGVAGFRGDIGEAMHWEVFGQYGKTRRTIGYLNDLDAGKVQNALLATSATACTGGQSGCVPANLFGFGNLSAAAAEYIAFSLAETDKNDQLVAGGFVSGDLPLELVPSRPAAFVAGVEYREESATANPDINLRTGNSIGFGSATPLDAKIKVKEIYGELKLPVFSMFSLEAGARYSDYKNSTSVDNTGTGGVIVNHHNSFKNWTWKIGGDFQPFEALRIRGMYQRAVRAPNLQEIGLPRTPGTGDASFDPCGDGIFDGSAGLAALCRAVGGGLPAGINPGADIAQPTSGQVNNFSGGNPNLVPEKATTMTLGAVFQPSFIRGFTASVDFYDIKVKKAILATPEQAIIDACYYAEKNPTGPFCSLIKRSQVDGTLEGDNIYGVDATRRNIGKLATRGIDVAVDWRAELTERTALLFGVDATYVLDSKQQFASVLKTYECAGKVGKTCLNPQPKFLSSVRAGIESGPWLAQVTWRHLSSITNDTLSVGYNLGSPSDFVVPKIPAYDYFDLAMRAKVGDRFSLRFGVDNLLNKKPPVVGNDYGGTTQNSGNTFPATYDPLGRFFSAGVNVKFW